MLIIGCYYSMKLPEDQVKHQDVFHIMLLFFRQYVEVASDVQL